MRTCDRFMWLVPFVCADGESIRSVLRHSEVLEKGKGSATTAAARQGGVDSSCNTIFVLLDNPVKISHIKFWNYSKTPRRGVKEIEVRETYILTYCPVIHTCMLQIFVDDVLVYIGSLFKSPAKSELHEHGEH